jgi:hypothetical protein
VFLVPHISSWNDRNKFTFPTFLSWIYIYRKMFHILGIAQIVYFWKVHCNSSQNMAMMMMKTMMNIRRRRGYLRTGTFE